MLTIMRERRKQFFTMKEISRATGIGIRTLDRELKSGALPSYKWDSWRRVRDVDLEAWLARHRRSAREDGDK